VPRQLDASFKKLLGREQAGQEGATGQSSPAFSLGLAALQTGDDLGKVDEPTEDNSRKVD